MVKLRKISTSDTDNIILWRNNEATLKYFIDKNKLTRTVHENWLKNFVDKGLVAQYIIVCNDKDVGTIFIKNVNHTSKDGEYGIFIGELDEIGKGIGTNASRLILDIAFNELNLERVYLRVVKDNIRAINIYKKIGFKLYDENDIALFMEIYKGDI